MKFLASVCALMLALTASSKADILTTDYLLQRGYTFEDTDIELFSQGISGIQPGTFLNFSKLLNLSLALNVLTEIPASSFIGLSSLQNLDLSVNNISNLTQGSFDGLTNLVRFGFSDNLLPELREWTFAGLTYLQNIDLARNKIIMVETGVQKRTGICLSTHKRNNIFLVFLS